jgi:hypothetical protein
MIYIEELGWTVKNVDDFNDYASEELEEFTRGLDGDNIRPYDPAIDHFDFNCDFVFTKKGIAAIEAKHTELYNIGRKYFDENDLNIQNSAVIDL